MVFGAAQGLHALAVRRARRVHVFGDRGRADEADRVVLGPSLDGGYDLIGLKGFHPALFRNIAWSTPVVFTATCEHAAQMGLPVHVLHEWYDVDEAEDLSRLKAEFDGQLPFPDAVIKGGPAWYTRALLADWAAAETSSS